LHFCSFSLSSFKQQGEVLKGSEQAVKKMAKCLSAVISIMQYRAVQLRQVQKNEQYAEYEEKTLYFQK